ncbi:MAG: hypothetical protein Kow0037_02910 [Calditrichia bacterium]
MKAATTVACPFCSLGCQYLIQPGLDDVIFSNRTLDVLDYDEAADVNQGGLCPRGHFSFELLSHSQRLSRSFYRENGKLMPDIPEQIFSKIAANLPQNEKAPLAILFDPKLSIHDIQALLDFAQSNKIYAIDFAAPEDRHLFRAMREHPFLYPELEALQQIDNCKTIFTIGDVFTSHPLISRHVLEAKYAFKANALLHLDSRTSRTAWFANRFIQTFPHTEPVVLGLILLQMLRQAAKEKVTEGLQWLEQFLHKYLPETPGYREIAEAFKPVIPEFIKYLSREGERLIVFAPQLYNSATGYLIGILAVALSALLNAYFIPLYNQANLFWLEKQAGNIAPEFRPGNRPVLHTILTGQYHLLCAMGLNPLTLFPGSLSWPEDLKFLIGSMVKIADHKNVQALLALSHFFEQNDLRVSFLKKDFIQSLPVKAPLGHAKSVAFLTFNLHQKFGERRHSLETPPLPHAVPNWKVNFEAEWQFYVETLGRIRSQPGLWLVPHAHVAHSADGYYSLHSSWAQKDCDDRRVRISSTTAEAHKLTPEKEIKIKSNKGQFSAKPEIINKLRSDLIAAYSHFQPARDMMEGVFAPHNQEHYAFCPKVQIVKS